MKSLRFAFIAAVFLASNNVQAFSSASFLLDFSNVSALNGTPAATVTVRDSDINDKIYIDVSIDPNNFTSPNNFGMDKFFFNSLPSNLDLSLISVENAYNSFSSTDHTSWWDSKAKLVVANNVSMFGVFDNQLKGKGNERITDLTLVIDAAGDDIFDYIVISDSTDPDAEYYFAAHIAGFDMAGVSSAFFSTGTKAVVPVPAAVWLLGSAMFGLFGYRRRLNIA